MAANTQAMCTSFKVDLLNGVHAFSATTLAAGARAVDTFKAALYVTNSTIDSTVTAYTVTGEVSGTGYTAGGINVTNATPPAANGTEADWTPSGSLVYSNVTLSTAFDAVLIYNSTQSNKSVSVHTFGSQTITAGTLTLTMPANTAGNALIRLA